jgi:hypothetical protein
MPDVIEILQSPKFISRIQTNWRSTMSTRYNYDPAIIPFLTPAIGSAYGRNANLEFQLEPMPDHLRDPWATPSSAQASCRAVARA